MKRQASVHDISWFLDLNRMGQLDLEPPYQRKSVWSPKDRRFFLDTIFRNYPCPPIFINKSIDEFGKTTYHIVDGKQRLETILMFVDNKISLAKDFGDDRFNGLKFKNLHLDEKQLFWNYSIAVDYITLHEGLDINEVFDRVNRNSRNLEPQELRHAKFTGWFISEAENEADENLFWQNLKVTTVGKAKRMRNTQVISELLMVLINREVHGFSQDLLDQVYALYDDIEDEELEFDPEAYRLLKHATINTINAMDQHNGCVSQYATTGYNLFSLWCFIALAKPTHLTDQEIANKYSEFMAKVEEIRSSEQPETLVNSEETSTVAPFDYFNNTRGASTDLSQRNARHNALIQWFSE